MTRRGKPGPVVVGVDGAGSADDAVDWASAEAAARGCPLRVVHAFRPPLAADACGLVAPIDSFYTIRTTAQLVLQDAVNRARSVTPNMEMSARLLAGPATRALLGQARDAQLLVLGSRGRSGLRHRLPGSVAGRVARRSPCPVVVIRPVVIGSADRHPSRSAPRVVVGVDPTSSGVAAAIGFAFQAAHQRGIPLTVLSAWMPDTAPDIETIPGPPQMAEAAADRAVQQTLARWREEFPAVPVITTLVCADPAPALIAESSGAALLVVGSSGRGHLRGLLCGSVSRTVLCDAGCPVAIVGRDRTTAGRTTAAQTRAEHRAVSPSGSTDRPRRQVFWIRRASQ
jgi:nucleotide-binding universal stress UspA family protein